MEQAMHMSDDELLQQPIEMLRSGDLDGALADLDAKMATHKTNAQVHHMYAEFANMKNMDAQDDVIPGGKIMMAYKKAMQLDEENEEYIADFASFALECRRIPVAVKEFQRYAKKLELNDIPTDEILFNASRSIVDAIGQRKNRLGDRRRNRNWTRRCGGAGGGGRDGYIIGPPGSRVGSRCQTHQRCGRRSHS